MNRTASRGNLLWLLLWLPGLLRSEEPAAPAPAPEAAAEAATETAPAGLTPAPEAAAEAATETAPAGLAPAPEAATEPAAPQAVKETAPAGPDPAPGPSGPEKSVFQIEVPQVEAAPETPATPAAAETAAPAAAGSAAGQTWADPEAQKLREQYEGDLRNIQRILQRLTDLRNQKERDQAQRAAAERASSGVPGALRQALEASTWLNDAAHKAYPGQDSESILQRADLFFLLGQYRAALQQYYVLRDDTRREDLKFRVPFREDELAWVLFQIGECERLLQRLDQAAAHWREVNEYFQGQGHVPAEHLENQFRNFTEDPQAAAHWSTGFWRRQALEAIPQTQSLQALLQQQAQVRESTQRFQQQARAFLPPSTPAP